MKTNTTRAGSVKLAIVIAVLCATWAGPAIAQEASTYAKEQGCNIRDDLAYGANKGRQVRQGRGCYPKWSRVLCPGVQPG